jgi:hypothetical protein
LEIIEEAYKGLKTPALIYYSKAGATKKIFNDVLTLMKKNEK